MAFGHKTKEHDAPLDAAASATPHQVLRPPIWYYLVKYFLWAAILAIAIGILAIMSGHLQKIPFLYDGPNPAYSGLSVSIAYCLLSDSSLLSGGSSQEIRCNVAIAAAAVSIALAVVWIIMQPFHNEADVANYKLLLALDAGLCLLGAGWWIAFGVLISLWTTDANNAGLPGSNWRNGVSAMAWLSWLLYSLLSLASFVRLSRRAQRALFTKKPKQQPKAAKDIEAPGAVAPAAASAAAASPAVASHATAAPVAAAPAGAATVPPAPVHSAAHGAAPLSSGPHGVASGTPYSASPVPAEATATPAGGLSGAAPGGAWGGASSIAEPTPAV